MKCFSNLGLTVPENDRNNSFYPGKGQINLFSPNFASSCDAGDTKLTMNTRTGWLMGAVFACGLSSLAGIAAHRPRLSMPI